ncbi:hypothetical protein Tco_0256402 [Tanacetum coccineum]
MTTPSNNNQMHNDIMAAGSRERPPMLALGHYAQWSSRFMRYVDMKANKNELRHCIEMGPYILTELVTEAVPATEVNEIRSEKIARNANPLSLVAATQHCPDKYSPDTYYQAPKPHKTHTSSSIHTSLTSSHATTRNKSKEIAKLITPPSESPSEEDSDPEQAQRDKDMHKNLALIAKYIKNIYKPTNNNIRTSSNTRNKILNDIDEEPDEQELETDYMYMPKIQEVPTADSGPTYDVEPLEKTIQIILFIVDSRCTKHITGNLKLLRNFIEKYMGTFYDADLVVAFQKSTCFVRDLQEKDLLTGNHGFDLYTISLQETSSPTPIYFMAKASLTQA